MKRTLILISALFLMSMGVLAQMNIWRNGVVTHEFLLSDVDSITFGAIQETDPGINIDPDTENYERTLLIEFFTGQGAGYDPAGITKIKEGINGIEDRVVWTSHHAGYAADDFTISNSESLVPVFGINGVPDMMLNRTNTTFAYETHEGGLQTKPFLFISLLALQMQRQHLWRNSQKRVMLQYILKPLWKEWNLLYLYMVP